MYNIVILFLFTLFRYQYLVRTIPKYTTRYNIHMYSHSNFDLSLRIVNQFWYQVLTIYTRFTICVPPNPSSNRIFSVNFCTISSVEPICTLSTYKLYVRYCRIAFGQRSEANLSQENTFSFYSFLWNHNTIGTMYNRRLWTCMSLVTWYHIPHTT